MQGKRLQYWLLLVVLPITVACAPGPEKAIVGKWQSSLENQTWEFYPDGTFTAGAPWDPATIGGDYKFIDKDRIRIEFRPSFAGPRVFTVSLIDKRLTLTTDDNQTIHLVRVAAFERTQRRAGRIAPPPPAVIDMDHARNTVEFLRSIAVACEAYSVDFNHFPSARSLQELRPFVQPTYIRMLPLTDGWEHPIAFRSDEKTYEIRSYGKDGKQDGGPPRGPCSDFAADIVYSNGRLVQWPEGSLKD